MKNQLSKRVRSIITGIFTLVMAMFLVWEYFYEDGVTTHYLLHSDDMPGMSNWWGILLIPIFTWTVTGFVKSNTSKGVQRHKSIVLGFSILVLFGISLSYAFLAESDMTLYLTATLLISAFFTPIYRAECLLGYLMGMLFTFGAVIPILFGTLFWLLFLVIHKGKVKLKKILSKNSYSSGT